MRLDLDVVMGNALIESIEYNGYIRLYINQVILYGEKVCEILNKKQDRQYFFWVERDDLKRVLADNLTCFCSHDEYNIYLLRGLTADDLRNRYRSFLSVDEMLAMTSDEARKCLNIPEGL